jgi:hypothetical protein
MPKFFYVEVGSIHNGATLIVQETDTFEKANEKGRLHVATINTGFGGDFGDFGDDEDGPALMEGQLASFGPDWKLVHVLGPRKNELIPCKVNPAQVSLFMPDDAPNATGGMFMCNGIATYRTKETFEELGELFVAHVLADEPPAGS